MIAILITELVTQIFQSRQGFEGFREFETRNFMPTYMPKLKMIGDIAGDVDF